MDLALLVGVCDYPGTNALKGCSNDVEDFKKYLCDSHGFAKNNVKRRLNSNAVKGACGSGIGGGILGALDALASQLEKNESNRLVFYFSGHGVGVQKSRNNKTLVSSALCPFDFSWTSDGPQNFISIEDLRPIFDKIPLQTRFTLVLDCCYSAGILPSTRFKQKSSGHTKSFKATREHEDYEKKTVILQNKNAFDTVSFTTLAPDSSFSVLAACGPKEQAWEECINSKEKGVFTYSMLQHLEQNPHCNIKTMMKELSAKLGSCADEDKRQHPEAIPSSKILDSGFLVD